MTREPFQSFAQNGEDVVLWRALCNLPTGRYVEVGANAPVVDSISWPFYQRGWRGITVEPVESLVAEHRALRPGDLQVPAVIGVAEAATLTFHEIPSTGLSTLDPEIAAEHRANGWDVVETQVPVRRLDEVLTSAGWDDLPIHFLVVDTEGSEAGVLATLDLRRWRPWVLVVEATAPMSNRPTHEAWEPEVLAAGYELCLFDGLSRFYVAQEHRDELGAALSYPACVLDDFTTHAYRERVTERDTARQEAATARARADALAGDAARWRDAALRRWDAIAATRGGGVVSGVDEAAAMRATVSWRVTRPLRTVRTRLGALRPGR